jgi:diadenosine tetraphosphate (Ap4A) HIT family hydrolase
MHFELHPNLLKKIFLKDLPLCRVLLEDEKNYPWLLLVPRRLGASKLIDLCREDQLQLLEEVNFAQHILLKEFVPTQINVGAIGNKTPQLHIHVIARFHNDPAWPMTVWDHPVRTQYDERLKKERILRLQFLLSSNSLPEIMRS